MTHTKKILTASELKEILEGRCPTLLTRQEIAALARELHLR